VSAWNASAVSNSFATPIATPFLHFPLLDDIKQPMHVKEFSEQIVEEIDSF
jgi:hypothetical protein